MIFPVVSMIWQSPLIHVVIPTKGIVTSKSPRRWRSLRVSIRHLRHGGTQTMYKIIKTSFGLPESASRPLVGFGVLNDNLIKCPISFVKVYEQILSNRYKGIHGYITRSAIMMQMELCDQYV
jgi:hypothetical protein